MSTKKHYANKTDIRQQTKLFADAVRSLSILGIEIMTVDFRHEQPLIEVFHCPGTERIPQEMRGRGYNDQGRYIRKVAQLKGCEIIWNEMQG